MRVHGTAISSALGDFQLSPERRATAGNAAAGTSAAHPFALTYGKVALTILISEAHGNIAAA
jgi:hypothetical protein